MRMTFCLFLFATATAAFYSMSAEGGVDTFTNHLNLNLNATNPPAPISGSVLQVGNTDGAASVIEIDTFSAQASYTNACYGGSSATPTALIKDTLCGAYNAYFYNGSTLVGPLASLQFSAAENQLTGHGGSYAEIDTTPIGASTMVATARFENNGGITIGRSYIGTNAAPSNGLIVQGLVGIGTAAPTSALHVYSGTGILNEASTTEGTTFALKSQNQQWNMSIDVNQNFQIYDENASATRFLIQKSNGYTGINTASPSYTLTVNGTAWVTNGTWSGSDKRWKKDIHPLNDSLKKISELQGVTYKWRKKDFPQENFSDGLQIGLIAQDTELVFPEIVTTNNKGYKAISYEKLVPVLVEAIKQLKNSNESQLKMLNKLTLDFENYKKTHH
jgi:trimeric autotransporter adhesin